MPRTLGCSTERRKRQKASLLAPVSQTMHNHLQEQDEQKPNEPAQKMSNNWTDLQTDILVQAVFEAIDNRPECFEQPTERAFYEQIKSKSPSLESIHWESMKQKMILMRDHYFTFVALKEEDSSAAVTMDDVYQKCPNFDKLAIIFPICNGDKMTPNIVYETAYHDSGVDYTDSKPNQTGYKPDIEQICIKNGSEELVLKFEVESRSCTPEPSSSQSCREVMETESEPLTTNIRKRRNIRQCTQEPKKQLVYYQPKKQKEKKVGPSDNEIKMTQLTVEKQQLDLAMERQRQAFEIKMTRIKYKFELKKHEIEKRIESNEKLKKYKIELKLKK